MPRWVPEPVWEGHDAYLVGGGPSLSSFPWDLIRGERVVGCNSAMLDPRSAPAVSVGVFGDFDWWQAYKSRLSSFGGLVVASTPYLEKAATPRWLLVTERSERAGLSSEPGRLAWNGNTGALGLNLALQLGARRVFLLGFDMKAGAGGRMNFHDIRHQAPNLGVFPKFLVEWRPVAADLPRKFPGREVVNVTDGSALDLFPKQSLADHFGSRRKVGAA